ncbi:MAG: hypothetical protein V4844_13720 [Pseudomonadota bacterium]|jgi:hypothetical protein|uniref:hypothetical protein n=1 Tax=Rhizobacter sp. Root404 TaxID=1736528 RepID=UPI0006FD3916|nr:hypothetical protein [Rhizobacter sp. Root404]KQW37618.1 hypothetical protein ASC76_05770 [Rhizobacter sp. Root404]
MNTLDEMRHRALLTAPQHAEIRAWVASARTPDAILQMPAHLWKTLELASVLMNVDADLSQAPALDNS